jgi:ribonuclease E
MAKEICISSTPHETRLAILEDDQLAEIYYARENEYTLAGSIYNGKVTRVLPGMQSAFVDVGLERDAFLYVTDFLELEDPEDAEEAEKAATTAPPQAPREVGSGNAADRGAGPTERTTGGTERGGGRGQRSGQRTEPKQDRGPAGTPDRQPREKRMVVEAASDTAETTSPAFHPLSENAEAGQEDSSDPGAKRWRGRRRRRGGRGGNEAADGSPETESTGRTAAEPLD